MFTFKNSLGVFERPVIIFFFFFQMEPFTQIIASSFACYCTSMEKTYGLEVVGHIPKG